MIYDDVFCKLSVGIGISFTACRYCERLAPAYRLGDAGYGTFGIHFEARGQFAFGHLVRDVCTLVLDERHIDDLVSLSAARSLVTGEAVEYDAQIRERIERIEESPDAEVEVPFITTAPKVLFMGDIRDNMDTYINYRFAQWWSKDAITGYHASL